MVNLGKLEDEIKEAKQKKEEEIVEAQIEVYEGQNYEAREAYEQAKQERTTARHKLPKDVPTDKEYQKQDIQAQYIQMRVASPKQEKQVQEYRAEIKRQREVAKSVQVMDKQLPQLYTSAVQEVETTKTKAKQAKEKVEAKYDAVIQTKQETYEKEKTRREAQFDKVEKQYQETLAKNPYVYKPAQRGRSFDNRDYNRYVKSALSAKTSAEKKIRLEHYTADDFQFASTTILSRGFRKKVKDYQTGMGRNFRRIDAGGQYKFDLWIAKEDLLTGNISESQYHSRTKKAESSYTAYKDREYSQIIKRAQTNSVSQLAEDAKHWAKVASNPYTSNPNYQTPNYTVGSGTKDDPFRKNYNADKVGIEVKDPPKEMLAYYLRDYQDQAKKYNKAKTGLETTTFKTTEGKDVTSQSLQQIQKQRETELANRRQQQYSAELRAGNIGLSDALLNPQTTQSYTGTSTVNLKTFLKERGYDLSKPEAIPDSVLTKPVKYTEAREQASDSEKFDTPMGDLRFKEPYATGNFGIKDGAIDVRYKYPEASAETQLLRRQAKERIAQFDPIRPDTSSSPIKFTNLKDPIVGTLDSKPLEQKGVSGFGITPTQTAQDMVYDYTVPSHKPSAFPLMSGQTFEAHTPTTFDTQKEAEDYVKSKPKERVFSGFGNSALEGWNYASAVETGEVIHPSKTETWVDDTRFRLSQVFRPTYNIGVMAYNLSQPEDNQLPIKSTAEDVLIGGTIDDVKEGNILKGTGVTGLGKYIEEDYFRAGLELPSALFTGWAGGKGITYGLKGVSYSVSATTKLGNKIIQSNTPTIIKVPTMAVMGAGQAVQRTGAKVSAIPSRIGSSIYEYGTVMRGIKYGTMVFTPTQQMVRQGIVKPYDKFTMFQGSRVGFGTKMNFIMTPSGRMFVRQATDIGSDIGARPQFLNRQVVMFETDSVTGFATRGEIKTVEAILPKAKAFESEVFTPTKKTELVLKDPPKEKKPFPELYDSKATTSGKPFPELVKVEDISTRAPIVTKPDIGLDRIKLTTIGQKGKDVKKVKTAIDEVTFYSDTTGDVIKGAKPTKAEIQGELDNYKAFEKPTITGTREKIIPFKTSTSRTSIKGELKYSEIAEGKIKLKGSPTREIDTVATGAKVDGKGNLKIIDKLVEKETLEEVGKKTVVKGTDYFAGGKKAGQLKKELESKSSTYYQTTSGKFKPKDETTLYTVNKKTLPVDKKAFSQTMKESNLLRELADKAPLNKKPKVPKGVDEPKGKYHAFIGESKSIGKTFQGTRVELGQGLGTTSVGSSFSKTNVDLGKGGGISNIKDVKGMADKPDVVGISTNKINVKKFEEPEIQKGDKIIDGKEGSSIVKTKQDDIIIKQIQTPVQLQIPKVKATVKPPKIIETPIQVQVPKVKATVKPPKVIETPIQLQIPKVKATVKPPIVSPKIKQIITPKVSQETGLIQESAQLTRQQIKQQSRQKIRQPQKLKSITGQKASTVVSAKVATIQMTELMKQSVPHRTETTKRKGGFIPPIPELAQRDRKGKRKKGKKAGFIGNVRLDSIVGMYKRQEIIYGAKKVRKLERLDMRLTTKTPNRLSTPSSSLLKTRKKKKKKSETILGRTVPKTKDEFSGFKENKSKKISLL